MITKTKSGHYDGDLCCGNCGRRGPWQPAEKDPCLDEDWWCAGCREWSEPVACGKNPWRYARRDTYGAVTLVPVCAGVV